MIEELENILGYHFKDPKLLKVPKHLKVFKIIKFSKSLK